MEGLKKIPQINGAQGADLGENRGIWGSSTHIGEDLVDLFHKDELMFKPGKKWSNFFEPLQTYIFWQQHLEKAKEVGEGHVKTACWSV